MRVDPAVVQEVASEVVLQLVLDGDIQVSPERVAAVERALAAVMRRTSIFGGTSGTQEGL